MKKLYAYATVLPLAAASSLLLFSAGASAHTADLTGTPECVENTHTVHWTGHTANTPENTTATITTTFHSPASSTVPTTVATGLPPNADFSFDQTDIPANESSASVSIHVKWSDNAESDANGSVTFVSCVLTSASPSPSPTLSVSPTPTPSLTNSPSPGPTPTKISPVLPSPSVPPGPELPATGFPFAIAIAISFVLILVGSILIRGYTRKH